MRNCLSKCNGPFTGVNTTPKNSGYNKQLVSGLEKNHAKFFDIGI